AGVATTAVAGCAGGASDETAADRDRTGTATATDTQTPTETEQPTDSETPTAAGTRLRLTFVSSVPSDARARVYPAALREWLRTVATTDRTLRVFDRTHVPNPDPIWPAIDGVELDGEAAGTYRLDATGGTRYHVLVGAERADPPDDATVTPVSALPEPRRETATAAIRDEGPRVYPETRLGEWVRTQFFGGYYALDGEPYRGHEVSQTDAAFFSHRVWYVVRAEPADPADPLSLGLDPIPDPVRRIVDPVLDDSVSARTLTTDPATDPAVRGFAADTRYLCTHTARFRVETV
ncbi:MAG: hypothetical protein ABEI75_03755, partial [Halobaculum sp.]